MSFLNTKLTIAKEELKGIWISCRYPLFFFIDLLLKCLGNPYRICSSWLRKQNAADIYVYGETPIATFVKIASRVPPVKSFIDLGSGRGRLVLFAALALKWQATGVEQVPGLVRRMRLVAWPFKRVVTKRGLIDNLDLSGYDLVYLAGTCMQESAYEKALLTMKKGATLVSVSAPVLDGFMIREELSLPFHFGLTDVYIQTRN